MTRRAVPSWAALLCASLVLRPPLSAVGPLIPKLQHDLSISHAVAGLVPSAVLLSMGLSSLAAPSFVRRLGWRRTTTAALLLIAAGGAARSAIASAPAVILFSIPIGIGAGIGGTSLPTAVVDLYRTRRATGTAIHALGINIGATGAAALAVPLADIFGGWRGSFAFFALAGLVLTAVWSAGASEGSETTRPPSFAVPWHDRRAWILTSLFALQGLCYYGFGAWLSDAYVEHGWSQGAGGALTATLTAAAVPASFLVPRASERIGSRLTPFFVSTVGLLGGAVLLAALPRLAWVGAVLVGLSLGGIFSLCLLLAVDLGRPTHQVAGFAGMMLGLGYTVSAAAPIVLGFARDAAGSFGAALWLIVAIAGSIIGVLAAGRRLLDQSVLRLPEPRAID
jgi:CP family cyanate transporter-like MFS transporter